MMRCGFLYRGEEVEGQHGLEHARCVAGVVAVDDSEWGVLGRGWTRRWLEFAKKLIFLILLIDWGGEVQTQKKMIRLRVG